MTANVKAKGRGSGSSKSLLFTTVLLIQLGLLLRGIGADYQFKHEDNNALHATFARSHLRLGLETTRAQNYYYNPSTGVGEFYPNHPPGPGLVLALVYALTDADGPLVTRATAIFFHLLGTLVFYGLARRLLTTQWEVGLAFALYALLPQSSFFGRMLNHEVLALPAALLVVRGYWELLHGGWHSRYATAAVLGGSAFAMLAGWAGFFIVAACTAHAAWQAIGQHNAQAVRPLALLLALWLVIGGGVVGLLMRLPGVDLVYLRDLAAARSAGLAEDSFTRSVARILELHWRYFGVTSAVALVWVALSAARRLWSKSLGTPASQVTEIFLIAGGAYVAVFLANAARHDYWQFLLLPASALAIPQFLNAIRLRLLGTQRTKLWRVAVVAIVVEMAGISTVTLVRRHVKRDGYVIDKVLELRRTFL